MRPKQSIFFIDTDESDFYKKEYNEPLYIMRWKMDTGDLVEMQFQPLNYIYDKHVQYWIILTIGKRKKGYKELQQTGRCGISGLIIAKQMLEEFIDCIYEGDEIIVSWDDKRRRKIYKKYLAPLGFKESTYDSEKVLRFKKDDSKC